MIQKIVSYEFGKLLKKYASVEDLNLSEDERRGGRGKEGRRSDRREENSNEFTTFSVNVGKEDGFTPRDLMSIINENAPRKGLEIGSIRIFETNTKFEVDIRGLKGFMSCFRNVSFNGLPFTLTEVKDRYSRERGTTRGRGREFGGGRRSVPANNKWRKSESGSRAQFSEKKKDVGGKKRRK